MCKEFLPSSKDSFFLFLKNGIHLNKNGLAKSVLFPVAGKDSGRRVGGAAAVTGGWGTLCSLTW